MVADTHQSRKELFWNKKKSQGVSRGFYDFTNFRKQRGYFSIFTMYQTSNRKKKTCSTNKSDIALLVYFSE